MPARVAMVNARKPSTIKAVYVSPSTIVAALQLGRGERSQGRANGARGGLGRKIGPGDYATPSDFRIKIIDYSRLRPEVSSTRRPSSPLALPRLTASLLPPPFVEPYKSMLSIERNPHNLSRLQ